MWNVVSVLHNVELNVSSITYELENEWDLRYQAGEGVIVADAFMEEILVTFQSMLSDFNDRFPLYETLGCRISGKKDNGDEVNTYVSGLNAGSAEIRERSAVRMLQVIGRAMQSNQSLVGKVRITLSGWNAFRNRFRLSGQRYVGYDGNILAFVTKRKGCVHCEVVDQCFLECMTLGMLYMNHEWVQGKNYTKARKPSGLTYRQSVMKQVSEKVLHLDLSKNVNSQTVQAFEEAALVSIVLINIANGIQIVYNSEYNPAHGIIYGLVSNPVRQGNGAIIWEHVDFVQEIEDLLQTGSVRRMRWCERCLVAFPKKKSCSGACAQLPFQRRGQRGCSNCHLCHDVCNVCHSPECDNQEATDPVRCVNCLVMCKSAECFHRHIATTCRRSSLCIECGAPSHPDRRCDESACVTCGEMVLHKDFDEHVCFVKHAKLKKPSQMLGVYDFECALQADRHVPYLVTLWFPYTDPQVEEYQLYKSTCHDVHEGLYVFFGEEALRVFGDGLRSSQLSKFTLFAHNAKSYDHHIIEEMLRARQIRYTKNVVGRKTLEMRLLGNRLVFRDSVSFIPAPLRSFSTSFGIEETVKGHFPHSFVTANNVYSFGDSYSPRPAFGFYIDDMHRSWGLRGEQELEELQKWYAEQPLEWNLKEEAIAYCCSDTILLGKALVMFRENMMDITSAENFHRHNLIKEVQVLDPLQYMTLPSAIMSLFISQVMRPDSIALINRHSMLKKTVACQWFVFAWKEKYGHYPCSTVITEFASSGYPWYKYCNMETSEHFWFLDCYEHGCPHCQSHVRRHERLGSFTKLRGIVQHRLSQMDAALLCVSWECQWLDRQKSFDVKAKFKEQRFDIDRRIPMDIREAYKGGKVEVYAAYSKKGEIQSEDVVSLYPAMMFGKHASPFNQQTVETKFPLGRPTKEFFPCKEDGISRIQLFEGVSKVVIVPPCNLFAPLLSHKCVNGDGVYEILYGLCRSCMEQRLKGICQHHDDDRSLCGTWTHIELREAISIGYNIVQVVDQWYYRESTTEMFQDLLRPFIKAKICSKKDGLIDESGNFTAQGVDVSTFLADVIGVGNVTPSMFENSAVKRLVAKLAQNAFYGKLGQKEERDESRIFFKDQSAECMRLLSQQGLFIKHVELYGPADNTMCHVMFQKKLSAFTVNRKKSDVLAAYVTGHARTYLNRIERSLGYALIYVDTDSAFHTKMSTDAYQSGYRMGDMEPDVQQISEWVGCGRKFYMYKKGESVTCKLKGFTLKKKHEQQLTMDRLKHLLMTMERQNNNANNQHSESTDSGIGEAVECAQTLFSTELDRNTGLPYKKTRHLVKRTHVDVGKRMVLWPDAVEQSLPFASSQSHIFTVPYGFLNITTL